MASEFEIQKALYTKLTAASLTVVDSASQAADGGVDTPFPYVEVGAVVIGAFDTRAKNGFDYVARIHTRSRSGSMKETKDIQGAIYAALHYQALTITGLNHVLIQRETSQVTRAPDGSFHGICEYRGLADVA